jgi:hypothetical protein
MTVPFAVMRPLARGRSLTTKELRGAQASDPDRATVGTLGGANGSVVVHIP